MKKILQYLFEHKTLSKEQAKEVLVNIGKGNYNEHEVTARDENNYIMALQHTRYDVQGVQFHPESVLTPKGEDILRNWLKV